MGASAEEIDAIRQRLQRSHSAVGEYTAVWPEHLETVTAFLVNVTQLKRVTVVSPEGWRTDYTGFDYAGVRAGLKAAGIPITPKLWHGMRVMELAACEALNSAGKHG